MMICRNKLSFSQNSIVICQNSIMICQNSMMICENKICFPPRTMDEVAREYQKLPEYLKKDSSRPGSVWIDRTVQPMSDTKKR